MNAPPRRESLARHTRESTTMTTATNLDDASVIDADVVARALGTDLENGLGAAEAAARLARDGPNELRAAPRVPTWRRILAQFQDPLVYLLLAAVVIALAAWLIEGRHGWPVDAIVIALVVIVNGALGYAQEAKAENAVAALAGMTAATCSVVRDGQVLRIPSAELVRGDVLLLAEGDLVGADARLLRAATLRVQEASLTGESEAVLKDPATLPAPAPLGDRLDMVFKGTAVAQGTGRAIVTATGMATEMGSIATMLDATKEETTPLQKEVGRIGRMLGIAVVIIAVVVVGTILLLSDIRTRLRRDHRAAARRVAGGRGGARGAAGNPVGGARAGRAAHGEAQRDREEAVVGGDAGLGFRHLLRQDRHAHPLGDDDPARHDGLRRHACHRRRLRAAWQGATRGRGDRARAAARRAHRRAQRRQPRRQCRLASVRQRRMGDPGRPHRSGFPRRRTQARHDRAAPSAASSASARSPSPPTAR